MNSHRIAIGLLIALIGGVYLATLHPGVGRGDSAELQYLAPLLGICHPPGYAIEVSCAKFWCLLPLPGEIAWRVNLLMAFCGTCGCLALYGTVRRITGRIMPGTIAALILGYSSIYWSNSILAEVYVFYGMVLLLGVYAAARFVTSDRSRWWYLTALLVGICIGERVSEVVVLPAFVGLWWYQHRHIRLGFRRLAVGLALLIVPFAYSVGFHLTRNDPTRPYLRDDVLLTKILERGGDWRLSHEERFAGALRYCLGLKWVQNAEYSTERMRWDVDKYLWLLSGRGGFGDRFRSREFAEVVKQRQQGHGGSIGVLGLVLAGLGVWFSRGRRGWAVFGTAMFAGNTAFYLCHQPPDNLDFTIPGLIGLALLAGLGVAGISRRVGQKRRQIIRQILCLSAPAFLLVSNVRFMNCRTVAQKERVSYCAELAGAPLPQQSVIVSQRNSGMVYRYLYHVVAGRKDIAILNADPAQWNAIFEYFTHRGRPVFLRTPPDNRPQLGDVVMPGDAVRADIQGNLRNNTPDSLRGYGFLLVVPG